MKPVALKVTRVLRPGGQVPVGLDRVRFRVLVVSNSAGCCCVICRFLASCNTSALPIPARHSDSGAPTMLATGLAATSKAIA